MALAGGLFLGFGHALSAEDSVLPIVGVELVNQGSAYANSGGGPIGDRHPEIGSGRRLVDDDGTIVTLDFRGNSLVVDLGQLQRIKLLGIRTTKGSLPDPFRNLKNGQVEILYSTDNKAFKKVDSFTESITSGEGATLWLAGFEVEARFIKVHSKFPGDEACVQERANKMLSVSGEAGPAAGHRLSLEYGLIQTGSNQVLINPGSIRPHGRLAYRFALWPYLRSLATQALENGTITMGEAAPGEIWRKGSLAIKEYPSGPYELEVECYDEVDGAVLWKETLTASLVSKIRRQGFPSALESIAAPAPGEALVITPEAGMNLPKGWTVDQTVPGWPLWKIPANQVAGMALPVALSGSYACYLGLKGDSDSARIQAGPSKGEMMSRAGRSENAINEAFFGVITVNQENEITINSTISPKPLEVAYLKILALTPAQVEVAKGKIDVFRDRKLIFYCDGYSIHGSFRGPSNFTADKFEAFADRYAESGDLVERFDFCQGTSSIISSHHSQVPHTEYPGEKGGFHTKYSEYVSQNIRENYFEKGLNPIEVMGHRLRQHHVPIYVGYRMNAWYDAPMDQHYVSSYWREHPEFRVQPFRGKIWAARSYAYPEIRDFNLAVIKEMLGLGVDGIHLEFMRHPPFVGYDAPLVERFRAQYGKSPLDPEFDLWEQWKAAQAEVMTGFLREVRALLDAEGDRLGKRFGLTARFDYRNYASQGLEVDKWAREGLVDALIPGDYYIRNRPFDLTPFLRMVEGTKVKVYSSLSPEETGTRDPTPADEKVGIPPPQGMIPTNAMKEFVADAFRQGAQGVYMFNNGGINPYQDWRQFRQLEAWDIYENPTHLSKFIYEPLPASPHE